MNLEPGIARSYLQQFYSDLPDGADSSVLNGHILYLHISNKTDALKQLPALAADPKMRYCVQRIQAKLTKFKRLTDSAEHARFSTFCAEPFSTDVRAKSTLSTPAKSTLSTPAKILEPEGSEIPEPEGSGTDSSVPPPTCLECTRLTGRVEQMTEKQKRHKALIKEIRQKQKDRQAKHQPLKLLNQKLKRKYAVITELKTQLTDSDSQKEVRELKESLSKLQHNHNRMKKYRRTVHVMDTEGSDQYKVIQEQDELLAQKNAVILQLENDRAILEEQITEMKAARHLTKDGKTFPTTTRLLVFESIVNQVPSTNIPNLLRKISCRLGCVNPEIPHRNTVELMARELGLISELQATQAIMDASDVTLGFDATTQEGIHVNSIHITTTTSCFVCAVDELPGGTARDYCDHVCNTIDNLSSVYSSIHNVDYQDCRQALISRITNVLTDRCAANHAAVVLINEHWGKALNELYCHLHPLDSLASTSRSALKQQEGNQRGQVFGKDCLAANVVLQMNKLRYKDGKGDPKGFKLFLEQNGLKKGLLPRYRGNRLHILFHLCGVYFQHHARFLEFLRKGTSCGGLRNSLLHDFSNATTKVELQVLGLTGSLLSGPWMSKFYTSAEAQTLNHVEAIGVVRDVVQKIRELLEDPRGVLIVLDTATDLFGDAINGDSALMALQTNVPGDKVELFENMFRAVLQSCLQVLERQYRKYFDTEVTTQLLEETGTARLHNIDAEEIMGMFGALRQKAPNATIHYLSCKMRAQKNRTVDYLDNLDADKLDHVLKQATKLARKDTILKRRQQKELQKEMVERQNKKQAQRDLAERKKLERKLKKMEPTAAQVATNFPELDEEKQEKLVLLLAGVAIGHQICHMWDDAGGLSMYNGKIEKLKKTKATQKYRVGYWAPDETYADATDYDMLVSELAADFILGDLCM